MKDFITISLAIVLSVPSLSQRFNFEQITVSSIDKLQSKENTEKIKYDYLIGVSKDYFPNRMEFSLAQPINYKKVDRTFQYQTAYYFSRKDSVVRLIEYQWEGSDSTSNDDFYLVVNKNKQLISEFFRTPGKDFAASDVKAAKTIWENKTVYVQQLFMPRLLLIRVLVSWK